MMKKVLPVAVATLMLTVGFALAEPPNSVIQNDYPGIGKHGPDSLAEADMAAVKGKGLRSEGCTLAVKGAGYLVLGAATILRDPFGQGIGAGLVGAAGAICA